MTREIISYGDSAFVPMTAEACGTAPYLPGNQVVLASSGSVEHDKCILSAKDTVSPHPKPIDPRLAIANFLFHANPSIISAFSSVDHLIEEISVVHSLYPDSPHAVTLHNVPGAVSEQGVPAKLSFVQHEGKLALTWSFEYQSADNWYEAHISAAHDAADVAQPLLVVDWQRDAPHVKSDRPAAPARDYAYRVFGWSVNDPSEGKRSLIKNPADRASSPMGWHTVPRGAGRDSGKKGSEPLEPESEEDDRFYSPGWSSNLRNGAVFEDTRGNNVFAQANPSGGTAFESNYRPQSSNGTFDYKLGWGKRGDREGHQVDPKSYINVSIT